ncbi:MAG: uroporphyrinogen decarboxylase family protein [Verrucomicrobiales bacterium]|jgi:uroporphyrinogen decarboxylase|nr:uroporphyrinogen decarboxylase family protein [Verrucomicrobiales bacterium]
MTAATPSRRDNFRVTLQRRERPAKVTVDLFGCPLSCLSERQLVNINRLLGFAYTPPDRPLSFAATPEPNEQLLRHYDIDTRGVGQIFAPKKSLFRRISDTVYADEWGIVRQFTGAYWDIVEFPLQDKSLAEIERYPFPDPQSIDAGELQAAAGKARDWHEHTDYAVCASHPVYGVFELACWLFGFDDWLYRMAAEPEVVHAFSRRYLDYQIEVSKIYYGMLGEYIDYTSSGDDFATQTSTFVSKAMFDELVQPYLKERIRVTKSLTKAAFLHHSCGSVASLIPSLVNAGVDILNPIQPVTPEMSPSALTANYGGVITFHGGFDTQTILPQADRATIFAETKKLLDAMGNGRGHIFAAAHNIQDDVPVENIDALFTAAQQYSVNGG